MRLIANLHIRMGPEQHCLMKMKRKPHMELKFLIVMFKRYKEPGTINLIYLTQCIQNMKLSMRNPYFKNRREIFILFCIFQFLKSHMYFILTTHDQFNWSYFTSQ